MWGLIDIIRFSASSLLWGVLAAVALYALFAFIIVGWYRNATITLPGIAVAVALFLPICFQCVMVAGATKLIATTSEIEAQVTSIVGAYYDSAQEMTEQMSDKTLDELIDSHPILQHYIGGGMFTGMTVAELPAAVGSELRSFLRAYIWRRVAWGLGFIVVGAIIVIKTMERTRYGGARRASARRATAHSTGHRPAVRRSGRRR